MSEDVGAAFSVVQKLTVLSLPHELFFFFPASSFLLRFFSFFGFFFFFFFFFLFFFLSPGLPPRSLSYLPFLFCF